MGRVVSIGECMVELSGGGEDLYRLGFAGDTFNTAYYLKARLSADWQVDYFTCVGTDIYSDKMLAHMRACDIGTGHIRRIPDRRAGLYMIHQAEGDRHFTYWRDTAAARLLADDEQALASALDGAEVVYFSGITLAILSAPARDRLLGAIGEKRRAGALVGFDPNIRPVLWPDDDTLREAMMAAAAVSSIVLPTHEDETPYFDDADAGATAQRYLDQGADEVVVKNGSEPALVAKGDERELVPAGTVEKVVDATGAGDSFGGAYIAARLMGASPAEAAEAGHATAGIVIAHHGALAPREALDKAQ